MIATVSMRTSLKLEGFCIKYRLCLFSVFSFGLYLLASNLDVTLLLIKYNLMAYVVNLDWQTEQEDAKASNISHLVRLNGPSNCNPFGAGLVIDRRTSQVLEYRDQMADQALESNHSRRFQSPAVRRSIVQLPSYYFSDRQSIG